MKRAARADAMRPSALLGAGVLLALLTGAGLSAGPRAAPAGGTAAGGTGPFGSPGGPGLAAPPAAPAPAACVAAADTGEARTVASEFYEIELVPTGNVTGTGGFTGTAVVRFADSPFDVAVSRDGTFRRSVRVDMRGLRPPPRGDYVVWATPPDLDPIVKLGPLGEDLLLDAKVAFPKFLLVVTLEEDPEGVRGRWSGPIVHRGMSRSGFLHTMAGHGPFQGEPCAGYGFR